MKTVPRNEENVGACGCCPDKISLCFHVLDQDLFCCALTAPRFRLGLPKINAPISRGGNGSNTNRIVPNTNTNPYFQNEYGYEYESLFFK